MKSGPIRCVDTDTAHQHIATAGDDKILKVWGVGGLKLLSQRYVSKQTPCRRIRSFWIVKCPKSLLSFGSLVMGRLSWLLISLVTSLGEFSSLYGRFLNVYNSYPLHPDPAGAPPTPSNKALSSHDNPAGGHLVLGHTSMLTTFLLTADEKYVVSADRDEHIRVSWYPQGYCIERFCLGHEKYVSGACMYSRPLPSLADLGGAC